MINLVFKTLVAGVLAALMVACSGRQSAVPIEVWDGSTQTYTYQDSCEHIVMNISVELPLGEDSIAYRIRDSLICSFVREMKQPYYGEEDSATKPFEGMKNDLQALVEHYGMACFNHLKRLAMDDHKERMRYLKEESELLEDERMQIMEEIPQWDVEFSVRKVADSMDCVIFSLSGYAYFGGAHGGVTGTGMATFDKKNGCKIVRFVRADAVEALQPLMRKGLIQYYSEGGEILSEKELMERLQVDGSLIPLPKQTAWPNAACDSLCFGYKQYEIACYADGMPTFMIAVKDLEQYLTNEGKALLMKQI